MSFQGTTVGFRRMPVGRCIHVRNVFDPSADECSCQSTGSGVNMHRRDSLIVTVRYVQILASAFSLLQSSMLILGSLCCKKTRDHTTFYLSLIYYLRTYPDKQTCPGALLYMYAFTVPPESDGQLLELDAA
jgi:hypothetical protein